MERHAKNLRATETQIKFAATKIKFEFELWVKTFALWSFSDI